MEPPPPFHGSASAVDNSGGGGGNDVVGSLGNVNGIDGVTGYAPTCLTNMAGPCVGQTPRANWSVGSGRGDSLQHRFHGSGEEGCGGRGCRGGHDGRRLGA